jgi:DNA replication protein DnaC
MNITAMGKKLKLPYVTHHGKEFLDEAIHTNMGHEEFLATYLERELELRTNNGIKRRLRLAKFPVKKHLEDFDKSKYGNDLRAKFKSLETLDFIDKKENIILIGTPGSGKTHYATALTIKAILEGRSALFVSVSNLIIQIKENLSRHQFNAYKRKFEKYDIVVLDELGFISFDKSGAEILFNLLSSRNDKGSIIITSNLSFDQWGDVFNDTVLTGALVDRLIHKAHILDISRETSHRFEETIEWIKNQS